METNQIYQQLDRQDTPIDKRELLATYLRKQLDIYAANPDRGQEVAYAIAGLMSTSFAQSLADGDPLDEILTLAGQLELPNNHQGDATWEELYQLIDKLP